MLNEVIHQRKSVPEQIQNKIAEQSLQNLTEVMTMYLFGESLPTPKVKIRTLRQYRQVAKSQAIGNSSEILLNSIWYPRPEWELAETIAHELLHLYHEKLPGAQISKPPYHNRQFLALAKEIGLKLDEEGHHLEPASGEFERVMTRIRVLQPDYVIDLLTRPPQREIKNWWDYDRPEIEGKSTLKKFICECGNDRHFRNAKTLEQVICGYCHQTFRQEGDPSPPVRQHSILEGGSRISLGDLKILFTANARVQLLNFFFSHPEENPYVRDLARKAGLEVNETRNQLEKLSRLGVVSQVDSDKNLKRYALNTNSDITVALSHIFPAKK